MSKLQSAYPHSIIMVPPHPHHNNRGVLNNAYNDDHIKKLLLAEIHADTHYCGAFLF